MIINAQDQIVGRVAAFAAKQAMLGNKVDIVNAEKAVITGNKTYIYSKYKRKVDMGAPLQGPYFIRKPEMMVKRIVRGMLPYKKEKGENAYKLIMCYRGIPDEFKTGDYVKVPGADISKVPNLKYMSIGEVSKLLGAKS